MARPAAAKSQATSARSASSTRSFSVTMCTGSVDKRCRGSASLCASSWAGVTSRNAFMGPSNGCNRFTPSSQASRRELYSPPACRWRTRLSVMSRRRLAASSTLRASRVRQSISSAWPATPRAAINWSMMPQRMPTNSFSARWQILAPPPDRTASPRRRAAHAWSRLRARPTNSSPRQSARRKSRRDRRRQPPPAVFQHRRDAEDVVGPVVAPARVRRIEIEGAFFVHICRIDAKSSIRTRACRNQR